MRGDRMAKPMDSRATCGSCGGNDIVHYIWKPRVAGFASGAHGEGLWPRAISCGSCVATRANKAQRVSNSALCCCEGTRCGQHHHPVLRHATQSAPTACPSSSIICDAYIKQRAADVARASEPNAIKVVLGCCQPHKSQRHASDRCALRWRAGHEGRMSGAGHPWLRSTTHPPRGLQWTSEAS